MSYKAAYHSHTEEIWSTCSLLTVIAALLDQMTSFVLFLLCTCTLCIRYIFFPAWNFCSIQQTSAQIGHVRVFRWVTKTTCAGVDIQPLIHTAAKRTGPKGKTRAYWKSAGMGRIIIHFCTLHAVAVNICAGAMCIFSVHAESHKLTDTVSTDNSFYNVNVNNSTQTHQFVLSV